MKREEALVLCRIGAIWDACMVILDMPGEFERWLVKYAQCEDLELCKEVAERFQDFDGVNSHRHNLYDYVLAFMALTVMYRSDAIKAQEDKGLVYMPAYQFFLRCLEGNRSD